MPSLEVVELSSNQLTTLKSDVFNPDDQPSRLVLNLYMNPLQCDSALCWLKAAEESGSIYLSHISSVDCADMGDVSFQSADLQCTSQPQPTVTPMPCDENTNQITQSTGNEFVRTETVNAGVTIGTGNDPETGGINNRTVAQEVDGNIVGLLMWHNRATNQTRIFLKPCTFSRYKFITCGNRLNGRNCGTARPGPDIFRHVMQDERVHAQKERGRIRFDSAISQKKPNIITDLINYKQNAKMVYRLYREFFEGIFSFRSWWTNLSLFPEENKLTVCLERSKTVYS